MHKPVKIITHKTFTMFNKYKLTIIKAFCHIYFNKMMLNSNCHLCAHEQHNENTMSHF